MYDNTLITSLQICFEGERRKIFLPSAFYLSINLKEKQLNEKKKKKKKKKGRFKLFAFSDKTGGRKRFLSNLIHIRGK
jgi:hypothetical protein